MKLSSLVLNLSYVKLSSSVLAYLWGNQARLIHFLPTTLVPLGRSNLGTATGLGCKEVLSNKFKVVIISHHLRLSLQFKRSRRQSSWASSRRCCIPRFYSMTYIGVGEQSRVYAYIVDCMVRVNVFKSRGSKVRLNTVQSATVTWLRLNFIGAFIDTVNSCAHLTGSDNSWSHWRSTDHDRQLLDAPHISWLPWAADSIF